MAKRYIRLYATPPPGKSIVVDDLDNRPSIAGADVPEAKWDVEKADGTVARMTGQQILDLVSGGTPGTGGDGRPAEIEIEDTADGIRLRGKSGDDTDYGPWFYVRDGAPGNPAAIEIEDIVGGIRVRGKSGDETEFGEWHVVRDGRDGMGSGRRRRSARGMTPFALDGMRGRRYGPMLPFNVNGLGGMRPYAMDPMDDKPSGTPMEGRFPKKRQSAEDVLRMFDGVPELVSDYMWDLIMDRIPAPTQLRDADDTYALIRAHIEGYVEGYTEAFSSTLKSKLEGIEDSATQDQSDAEILGLLVGLSANQRDSLRNAVNAQVQGSYAPGSTISATVANVLLALQGLSSTQEGQARVAIQALGRDITLHSGDGDNSNRGDGQIIIEMSSSGDISVGLSDKTIAPGSTWIGIDFAGGVI